MKGIDPDLFYGTYVPVEDDPAGARLVARNGLADCLSVYDSGNRVDANTAAPPVLAAVGLPPAAINALLARRRLGPLTDSQLMTLLQNAGASTGRLRTGATSMVLLPRHRPPPPGRWPA